MSVDLENTIIIDSENNIGTKQYLFDKSGNFTSNIRQALKVLAKYASILEENKEENV